MEEYRVKGNKYTALALCAVVAAICFITAQSFMTMWKPDKLVPAAGFKQHMLSEWQPELKGTHADTPVFIQDGKEPGGTVYVEGGIHANEPAGFMAAIVLLENAKVEKGRLIVVPFVSNSARTHNSPQDAARSTSRSSRRTDTAVPSSSARAPLTPSTSGRIPTSISTSRPSRSSTVPRAPI